MVYRAVVALLLLFTALVSGAWLVGNTQSNPLDVLFAAPDGSPCPMPCLFGVRPGQMTVDEALQILQQHPLTRKMRRQVLDNGVALESDGLVLLIFSNDGTRINWLNLEHYWLSTPDNPLPAPDPRLEAAFESAFLGNVVIYMGTPTGVEFEDRRNHLMLWSYYPDRMISFGHTLGRDLDHERAFMDVNGSLLNLFVYPTNKDTEYPEAGYTHWLGFTLVDRYLRDANAR